MVCQVPPVGPSEISFQKLSFYFPMGSLFHFVWVMFKGTGADNWLLKVHTHRASSGVLTMANVDQCLLFGNPLLLGL